MHAYLNGPSLASNQMCAKIGYPSRREAMRMLRKHSPPRPTVAHGSGVMRAYRCRVCRLFHLGHP